MILTIDNLDNAGPRDYSSFLDGEHLPRIVRKYNQAPGMQVWLTGANDLTAPTLGARVELRRRDGSAVFTGYLSQAPQLRLARRIVQQKLIGKPHRAQRQADGLANVVLDRDGQLATAAA